MKADLADGLGASPAGRSILIIEDHDDAREALRALLELEGHHVAAAATGPHGVEIAMQDPPEVALIDIGLPEVDGYEVARRLRGLGTRCPYLIALTGYGQPDDVKRARDAGFDAHLLKPVDPDALASVLNRIFDDPTRGIPGRGSRG
jgi:two-component system, sensor histidine kinase